VTVTVAGNVVTSVAITSNGVGYTNLSGLTLNSVIPTSGSPSTAPTFSFTGSVEKIEAKTGVYAPNGMGYFAVPTLTLSAPPTGTTATANVTLSSVDSLPANFTTTSRSNPLTPNLTFGVSNAAPNELQLDSGLRGSLRVDTFYNPSLLQYRYAQNLTVSGSIDAPSASTIVFAQRDIRLLSNVRSAGLYLSSVGNGTFGFGNIALSGADVNITSLTELYSSYGSINVSQIRSGIVIAQSNGTITATGAINAPNGAELTSDRGGLVLGSGGVAAASGNVVLSAQDPANGTLAGNTTVSAVGLTIREGKASAVPYTITGNVAFLTADLASNVTFTNARSMTVGAGNLTTNGANLTIQTQGSGSDLSIVAPITSLNATGTNISLNAAGNVGVVGEIRTNNGALSIRAGGNIVAGARLNASTNSLSLNAGTGIDGGNNVLATAVTANTTTGDIKFSSATSSPLNIAQATTGSGNVSLQTIQGNLAVIGPVSTANGNITIAAGSAAQTLELNGAISTPASGTVFLSAANVSGGTISNGTNFSLTTGTLNFTAANSPAFFTTGAAAFGNLSASLLGMNNALLNVVVDSSLNVTGISTLNSPVQIQVDNGDLAITGAVVTGSATSAQNITLRSPNGSITAASPLTANVLNVTANSTSSLSTNAAVLIAAVTGAGQNLAVTESNNLQIGTSNTTNVTANGGFINIQLAGNLTGPGFITANGTGGLGNVTLNSSAGNVSVGNLVTANVLNVRAATNSLVATNVATLIAAVTGAGQNLTINEANDLQVGAANVTSNGGFININLATGNLTGPGFITASGTGGTGNITLNASAGNVSLDNQVTANILSLTANSTSALSTNAATLIAAVTGAGQNLTVTEANDLRIGTAGTTNVTANGGFINIQLAGNLTGPGFINANGIGGLGNVTLNSSAGNLALANQVTANLLSLTANSTSALSTNAATLVAAITGAGQNLTVNEANNLQVGTANVTTNGGFININLATGNLTGPGFITASGTGGTGNVALNASAGNVSLANQVTADVLSLTANSTSALSTNAATLIAAVTGSGQNLTITEANELQIGTSNTTNVTSNGGFINIQLAGNLTGPGFINANGTGGLGNVTLNSSAGNLSLGNQVTANVLNIRAATSSSLATNVATLNAAITGAGQNLTVNEANDLQVGAANITSNGGFINIQLGTGNLTSFAVGSINASGTGGTGNITLNAPTGDVLLLGDLVTANVLNVTANAFSTLLTDVDTLSALMGQGLSIIESNDLQIGPASVIANGPITIQLGGNLSGSGQINANSSGGLGNVDLDAATGNILLSGLITGDRLHLTANTTSSVVTNVANLAASITAGDLTVTETNGLTIDPQNVTTGGSGNISISVLNGDLNRIGAINAGPRKVTLNVPQGLINGTGRITGNWLDWTAQNQISSTNTSFSTLSANVTGPGNHLVVDHAADLTVVSAATHSGNITFNANALSPTNLTINGLIQAGQTGGNQITLNVTNGSITTNASGLLTGSLLNVTARNTSSLNTNVANLAASITAGDLTVTETNGLTIDPADVVAAGPIAISATSLSSAAGAEINAGAGNNVTLTATSGAATLAGLVTGNVLSVAAQGTSSLNTNVSNLAASITGAGQSLTVTETDNLLIGTNVATNNGNVTISAGGGITGTGSILGNVLNVSAVNATSLNTNVATLIASITGAGQSLTVTETDNLLIGTNVATNNGNVTISAGGGITGTGRIRGNVLNATAVSGISLLTAVATIQSRVTGTGDIRIEDEDNIVVGVGNTDYNGAITANGSVTIKTPASNSVTVNSIDAATGSAGNVVIDTGSLFINSPGIRATGTVDLRNVVGSTVVQPGGQVDAGNGTILKPNDSLLWTVTNNNTSGPGSLADVIADVNASGAPSTITITGSQTIVISNPGQALPEITTPLTLNGNGNLVIDGTGAGNAAGLVVNGLAGGNGVKISGVTLRNFRDGTGISLVGTANTQISQVTVADSAAGLRATGSLSGTSVVGSTFTRNREAVVIQDATGFRFGMANTAGNFNTISNSLSVGMSISGVNGGTRVFGNRFVSNPIAIRLTAAKGNSPTDLLLIGERGNRSSRNTIQNARVGILATGFCTYAQVNNTAFSGRVTTRYQVSRSRGLRVVR
jgi:hypothetical protein